MIVAQRGAMIVSLDFELYWGVHDVISLDKYQHNLIGVQQAIEQMLQLFTDYNIQATWAIVGLLYCHNKKEINKFKPALTPNYTNEKLSAYHLIENKLKENDDSRFYFAPTLINQIAQTPHQEIATHTFSHYYTLEPEQTLAQFTADLDTAIRIAKMHNHTVSSIIFPRNQINKAYLQACFDKGITAYRGNERGIIYNIKQNERKRYWKRGMRFIDRYINLTGHQTYPIQEVGENKLHNIPASRFLNPYSPSLAMFERVRLRRIKRAMTYAAKHGEVFHLWWHPHNFGIHLTKNMSVLEDILQHYVLLKEQYGFISKNMTTILSENNTINKITTEENII